MGGAPFDWGLEAFFRVANAPPADEPEFAGVVIAVECDTRSDPLSTVKMSEWFSSVVDESEFDDDWLESTGNLGVGRGGVAFVPEARCCCCAWDEDEEVEAPKELETGGVALLLLLVLNDELGLAELAVLDLIGVLEGPFTTSLTVVSGVLVLMEFVRVRGGMGAEEEAGCEDRISWAAAARVGVSVSEAGAEGLREGSCCVEPLGVVDPWGVADGTGFLVGVDPFEVEASWA